MRNVGKTTNKRDEAVILGALARERKVGFST
jgi:hypothetical protein